MKLLWGPCLARLPGEPCSSKWAMLIVLPRRSRWPSPFRFAARLNFIEVRPRPLKTSTSARMVGVSPDCRSGAARCACLKEISMFVRHDGVVSAQGGGLLLLRRSKVSKTHNSAKVQILRHFGFNARACKSPWFVNSDGGPPGFMTDHCFPDPEQASAPRQTAAWI